MARSIFTLAALVAVAFLVIGLFAVRRMPTPDAHSNTTATPVAPQPELVHARR